MGQGTRVRSYYAMTVLGQEVVFTTIFIIIVFLTVVFIIVSFLIRVKYHITETTCNEV